jgi:hypothetical protein
MDDEENKAFMVLVKCIIFVLAVTVLVLTVTAIGVSHYDKQAEKYNMAKRK